MRFLLSSFINKMRDRKGGIGDRKTKESTALKETMKMRKQKREKARRRKGRLGA